MILGIALMIGKYVFVALLYLLVYAILRTLAAQVTAAARSAPRAAPAQPRRGPRARPPAPAAPVVAQTQAPKAAMPVEPSTAPEPEVGFLTIVNTAAEGLSRGARFPLRASASIGRKLHNDIALQDRYVSATHALIIFQDGQHLLRDYHSTNGTLHNGIRVDQDVALRDGDEITVGTTVFRYHS